jgi:hypothetical protein
VTTESTAAEIDGGSAQLLPNSPSARGREEQPGGAGNGAPPPVIGQAATPSFADALKAQRERVRGLDLNEISAQLDDPETWR